MSGSGSETIGYLNKYGSIEQFRHVMKDVRERAEYHQLCTLPVIEFNGTVKLHGTNAAIGYKYNAHGPDLFWCQSRRNIITPSKDNVGFAAYFEANRTNITRYIRSLARELALDEDEHVLFFGEWCGAGIQHGVGISELPKRFIVFEIQKIKSDMMDNEKYRYPIDIVKTFQLPESQIWNIYQFKQWNIKIDFNDPTDALTQMQELVDEVEKECPVAKHFGVSGTGEGIVWRSILNHHRYTFKVKGDKHKMTKPKNCKKIASNPEMVKSVNEFVSYAVAEGRLEQGWNEVVGDDKDKQSMKSMGRFIGWIHRDVAKEEMDTLLENGLTMKDVSKAINVISRDWFKTKLNSL